MKKPLCYSPFKQLVSRPDNQMLFCCTAADSSWKTEASTLAEAWNDEHIVNIRKMMLEHDLDNLPKSCQKCIKDEGPALIKNHDGDVSPIMPTNTVR